VSEMHYDRLMLGKVYLLNSVRKLKNSYTELELAWQEASTPESKESFAKLLANHPQVLQQEEDELKKVLQALIALGYEMKDRW
jgi:glycerol dehydrogenase-like iron-containing ADH family enzyme